jgi:hypothetical protein
VRSLCAGAHLAAIKLSAALHKSKLGRQLGIAAVKNVADYKSGLSRWSTAIKRASMQRKVLKNNELAGYSLEDLVPAGAPDGNAQKWRR